MCASVPELCCEELYQSFSHIFLVVKINLYIQRWCHFSLSGDHITSLIIGFFIPLWLKRSLPDPSWVWGHFEGRKSASGRFHWMMRLKCFEWKFFPFEFLLFKQFLPIIHKTNKKKQFCFSYYWKFLNILLHNFERTASDIAINITSFPSNTHFGNINCALLQWKQIYIFNIFLDRLLLDFKLILTTRIYLYALLKWGMTSMVSVLYNFFSSAIYNKIIVY